MIICKFTDDGFTVSGHSGYSESGSDIVCAAVSAMTMLVCNVITDKLGCDAVATAEGDTVTLKFGNKTIPESAKALVDGFKTELLALSEEYPKNIRVL